MGRRINWTAIQKNLHLGVGEEALRYFTGGEGSDYLCLYSVHALYEKGPYVAALVERTSGAVVLRSFHDRRKDAREVCRRWSQFANYPYTISEEP